MKNQGYYSWIHTLKSAAMQARQNGVQLNEEKARKITDTSRIQKLEKGLEPTKPVEHGKPNIDPAAAKIFAQELAKTGPVTTQTIANAGGDVGAFISLQQIKAAQDAAMRAKMQGPIDAAPEGDAEAVEDDAQDGVLEDPPLTKLPSYGLASQARAETAELEAQKAEEEAHEEEEEARYWSDYSGRTGEVAESILIKIKKMMNEKLDPVGKEDGDIDNDGDEDRTDEYLSNRRQAIGRSMEERGTGGTMRTGPSAETLSDINAFPSGFLKPGQEPLAAILNVMKNPSKHPPAHREFAQKALAVIQSKLQKDS